MEKVLKIEFPLIKSKTKGLLRVLEEDHLPINAKRIFYIMDNAGVERGKHAHILCKQYLVCLSGKVELLCDNGKEKYIYNLEPESNGILIKNGVWTQQKYLLDKSILLVVCDRIYEKHDYIHDYYKFISWCKKN